MRQIRQYFVYGVIVIILIYLVVMVVSYMNGQETQPKLPDGVDFSTFDQALWEAYPYARAQMVEDLLTKYDMNAMSRDEVISLLGTNAATDVGGGILYTIGQGQYTKCLAIYFDSAGKVREFTVYDD